MALPGPDENNPADVPTDIDKLRQRIDATAAMYLQGTTASRPAAGIVGRLFFSTDEHLLYYDDGSVWQSPFTPPGTLRLSAAAAAASGWLLCDGAAYPRAEYAALFAAIGTAWGAGDGSSTFNVPDLRGRAPLGAGTGTGLTARTVGQKAGEENHTLLGGEMPSHAHAGQTSNSGPFQAGTGRGIRWGTGSNWETEPATTTGYAGLNEAHNNMPPFA